MSVEKLVDYIKTHRCHSHPVFTNWARINPESAVVAALFHQIRSFCDATRPGHAFPGALVENGLPKASEFVLSITQSEEGHGPELATMAGHILNAMSSEPLFADVFNQQEVEAYLKKCSDSILARLPAYDTETGLLVQTRVARSVFDGRSYKDSQTTFKNMGVTLALEIISNEHLIPGEKHCLVDSGLYKVSIEDDEMHYLKEHWGECGAEQMHQESAMNAVRTMLTSENENLFFAGAKAFLDAVAAMWDTLDAALLGSGYMKKAS